jgi:hypothetical protein
MPLSLDLLPSGKSYSTSAYKFNISSCGRKKINTKETNTPTVASYGQVYDLPKEKNIAELSESNPFFTLFIGAMHIYCVVSSSYLICFMTMSRAFSRNLLPGQFIRTGSPILFRVPHTISCSGEWG